MFVTWKVPSHMILNKGIEPIVPQHIYWSGRITFQTFGPVRLHSGFRGSRAGGTRRARGQFLPHPLQILDKEKNLLCTSKDFQLLITPTDFQTFRRLCLAPPFMQKLWPWHTCKTSRKKWTCFTLDTKYIRRTHNYLHKSLPSFDSKTGIPSLKLFLKSKIYCTYFFNVWFYLYI